MKVRRSVAGEQFIYSHGHRDYPGRVETEAGEAAPVRSWACSQEVKLAGDHAHSDRATGWWKGGSRASSGRAWSEGPGNRGRVPELFIRGQENQEQSS